MGNSAPSAKCGEGGCTGRETKSKKAEKAKSSGEPTKRLLDYYTVSEMLGQGTFGVVYACKPKGQDRECAVKMVDKVETPVDKIKEEADFLRRMNHYNVIKCYDVIYEKCFVCIVMDRLKGGDLILGMQAHWKATGRIPFAVSSRIAAQMGASLDYLHAQNLIHRDIKGDNYLTDRKDITDPDCRVVLTDFGTGKEISPGQRLHEKCGTKLYWSPEFFKMDYSLKVDVWAMGVVFYGLLCGRFPFRNESEANKKQLSFGEDTPADAQDLSRKMLGKTEDTRASAAEVMKHKFLEGNVRQDTSKAPEGKQLASPLTSEQEEEQLMREFGADHGVKDRRFELVERLLNTREQKESSQGSDDNVNIWNDSFTITDKRAGNSAIRYEWHTATQVSAEMESIQEGSGVTKLEGAKAVNDNEGEKATEEVVMKQLEDHGIDTSKFGQGEAKTLRQLTREVQSGAAVLMLDAQEHKKLVRVVDVVVLRICAPGTTNKYFVEIAEQFPDGRKRNTHRLPGTKKEPHENAKQTAERIVKDMLPDGTKVDFDFNTKEVFEEEKSSPSYPGVCTVYRKEIVAGKFVASSSTKPEQFKSSFEWSKKDPDGNTKFFCFQDAAECFKQNIVYSKPEERDECSALVQAPIGLNVEDLTTYLKKYSVDISQFGRENTKTLEDFSEELQKGQSSLCHGTDGSIIRVVDVVLLKLKNAENGKILVQSTQTYPDGKEVKLNRLPGTKRRPDENQFLTCRTIVQRQLQINSNHVSCDAKDVISVEEEKPSLAYPGLRTVYRKRIVQATLQRS